MSPPNLFLDLSDRKRVFIVGDLHGEFELLEEELKKVAFNSHHDSLISVGDLVDRGPDSKSAMEYIKKPWFHRVLGNHDVAPAMFLSGQLSYLEVEKWGGQWYLNTNLSDVRKMADLLIDAPYALTVKTLGGFKIGITHADCLSDWNEHVRRIQDDSDSKIWVRDLSIWSRDTIRPLKKEQDEGASYDVERTRVKNIDHVFHGHTVLGRVFTCANRTWIDTGACYGHELSVLDIDQFLLGKGV